MIFPREFPIFLVFYLENNWKIYYHEHYIEYSTKMTFIDSHQISLYDAFVAIEMITNIHYAFLYLRRQFILMNKVHE